MAFLTGKTMNIQIDNSGGTLVDLTQYANSMDLGFPVDMLDTTVFGSSAKSFVPGFIGGDDIVINFRYDPTLETHLAGISNLASGVTTTVQIAPEGTTTGKLKISQECLLMNYQPKATPEAIVEIVATFRKTGAFTRGVF